jgi:hypothetical protein
MSNYTWVVRVHRAGHQEAKVYARNHAFTVGQQASFKEADPHPSAVEYLLGALGGDLVNGFQAQANRRRHNIYTSDRHDQRDEQATIAHQIDDRPKPIGPATEILDFVHAIRCFDER